MKKKALAIAAFVCIAALIIGGIWFVKRDKSKMQTVVFYSDDDTILEVVPVNPDAEVPIVPPQNPELTYGNVFTKWATDFTENSDGKMEVKVYPEYQSVKEKENVFAMPGIYGKKGEKISVPLSLCGKVALCGFDITVTYDSNAIELEEITNEDDAVLFNPVEPGRIKLNYVSNGNTTADVDVCILHFVIKTDTKDTDVSVKVDSIYAEKEDGTLYSPQSNVIDSKVYLY